MAAYTQPPDEVPVVRVDGTTLQPAQYAWRIDGEFRTLEPSSDRDVAITRVSAPPEHLAFSMGTSLHPLQARVLLYRSIGEDQVPVEESASTLDCLAETGCRLVEGPSGLVIEVLEKVNAPALVVLDVQYATLEPTDADAGIASYGASWVVRLVGR
jgi:hypothetical protein